MELYDVLEVAKQTQYFHFVGEEGLVDFALDVLHVDQLEGNRLSLVRQRVPSDSFWAL